MRRSAKPAPVLITGLLGLILLWPLVTYGKTVIDSPLETTQAAFRQVPCMEDELFRYYKGIISALSYTHMRALRSFCQLPETTADEAISTLQRLIFYPLSFDQVQLLEYFTELPGASSLNSWQLLDETTHLPFTTMQAVTGLVTITDIDIRQLFGLLNVVKTLDDAGHWAAKALFGIKGMNGTNAAEGLSAIARMGPEQARASEKVCQKYTSEPVAIVNILTYISRLDPAGAANSAAFFTLETIPADEALVWLKTYFSQSRKEQEKRFYALPGQQKAILLQSFSQAAGYSIRVINDLHAVTNKFGGEISTGSLAASSRGYLEELLSRLHPGAKQRFRDPFLQALDASQRYEAIENLKQATAYTRKLTGRDLGSANIYILLSHGSELYDSSFRDILVPVLLTRINHLFNGNLLEFLLETDPLNNHVSDFIVSCAQKGKLTAFFPDNEMEQRRIIDLMAQSAFQDEQSLILFSATFATLLAKIQPDARTYLIQKMVDTIRLPATIFALQLRVILQYYHDKHSELLRPTDLAMIGDLIDRYGPVDFSPYILTDFKRWKQDGHLRSLSIFQQDDDGQISYVSNSKNLIKNGYTPRLSTAISLLPPGDDSLKQARRVIEAERSRPDSHIGDLYRLSVRAPLIVEWYKEVNGVELSHSVAVYQSKFRQRELLKQFLLARMEMFAQRGHSYWREEQLLEPMRHLLESGQVDNATLSDFNRFMSIGSCGGLRVYSELNRLFNNQVDIFATVGTGKAVVNDPYNRKLFEIIATSETSISWDEVARQSASIFVEGRGSDYLQPGSLPAILHKMMDTRSLN